MKRRLFLLSILASLSLCGCDALDAFFADDIPTDQKEDEKKEEEKVPTIESISISGDLSKKEYIVGESWSAEGLSVLAHLSNDKDETLESSLYEFFFDSDRPALGITSLEVTAKLLESEIVSEGKSFTVTVADNVVPEKEIDEIVIDGVLENTIYDEDDEWISTGLSVTGIFDDDTEQLLPSSDYVFIFNPTKALKGTTEVSIKAKLKDKELYSETLKFYVTVNSTVTPENYTVTFVSNAQTTGTMPQDTVDGHTYLVPDCDYLYEGYKFKHWALNSIVGTFYNPGDTIVDIHQNIVLYAIWEADDSGEDSGEEYNGYYKGIDASASNLLKQLQNLNEKKRTSTVGYGSMGTDPSGQFKYTDYDPNTVQYDSNGQPYGTKIISFYSGNSTTSWNREHVWPNSHGGGSVDNDIHMPRPTIASENGSRGNSFYVEGMKDQAKGWDPAMESFGDATYRGDSVRIIFYCVVANSALNLSELTYHETTKKNPDNLMGKLSDMLKWNLQYPVDPREQRRNEGAQYLQGNRNPFIDHPEYACKIWGATNDATKKVCGIN